MRTISKYDCIAITEILPAFGCKRQGLNDEYRAINAERPRCTRSRYAALAMPKKLWAEISRTYLAPAAMTKKNGVPLVGAAI